MEIVKELEEMSGDIQCHWYGLRLWKYEEEIQYHKKYLYSYDGRLLCKYGQMAVPVSQPQ